MGIQGKTVDIYETCKEIKVGGNVLSQSSAIIVSRHCINTVISFNDTVILWAVKYEWKEI
jgi:hypothetical protein